MPRPSDLERDDSSVKWIRFIPETERRNAPANVAVEKRKFLFTPFYTITTPQ